MCILKKFENCNYHKRSGEHVVGRATKLTKNHLKARKKTANVGNNKEMGQHLEKDPSWGIVRDKIGMTV